MKASSYSHQLSKDITTKSDVCLKSETKLNELFFIGHLYFYFFYNQIYLITQIST